MTCRKGLKLSFYNGRVEALIPGLNVPFDTTKASGYALISSGAKVMNGASQIAP
jgi:hypothetical protein